MLDPARQARWRGATRGRASTTLILVETVVRDAVWRRRRDCAVALQCAEVLCTDAALTLDAARRAAAAAGSGGVDLRLRCAVEHTDELKAASTVLLLAVARRLILCGFSTLRCSAQA